MLWMNTHSAKHLLCIILHRPCKWVILMPVVTIKLGNAAADKALDKDRGVP